MKFSNFNLKMTLNNTGFSDRLESFVYPNGLLTIKTLPLKPGTTLQSRMKLTTYTKHYYIGAERISSSLGRANDLGLFCKDLPIYGMDTYLNEMDQKTIQVGNVLESDYQSFNKILNLNPPILYNNTISGCSLAPDPEKEYAVYWFHPDHLGSSSYISNLSGEISQHLEYLPFGETLVEEHKNSNNSPYKFNAKELDDETGNYYYGARYLNPKWSFWLSVDPLAEKYHGWSSYNYTLQNPLRFIDPDGRAAVNFNEDPPYDKWGRLNRQEKNIILWDPQFYKAKTIEKKAGKAFEMTKATFGHQGKGDESDAFRHAFWMATSTQEAGERFSQKWGDAHEYSTPVDEISTDLYMDIHNNDVGIEIGRNNPNATPEELRDIILDRMDKGDFLIINENNKLIKSDGSLIKEGDIRRRDTSREIGNEILKENK